MGVSSVVPFGASGRPVAASVGSVVFSAFRAGSLFGVRVRVSRRSPSGVVLVAGFASPVAARRFALLWGGRLGAACAVRVVGGFWCVSVPVFGCVPFSAPSGWRVAGGGVRRVAAVAFAAALAVL